MADSGTVCPCPTVVTVSAERKGTTMTDETRGLTDRAYRFDELTDAAKERAVQSLRERLSGAWWDSADTDDVTATMVYTLAEKLGAPGWDTYGVSDFPGIDGVEVDGWDIQRNQSLALSGKLDRDNAPALPWVDGIEYVELHGHRSDSKTVTLVDDEPECTCSPDHYLRPHDEGCPSLEDNPATDEQRSALESAVREAISDTWSAGESEGEYMSSEERAREVADDYEFTKDGAEVGLCVEPVARQSGTLTVVSPEALTRATREIGEALAAWETAEDAASADDEHDAAEGMADCLRSVASLLSPGSDGPEVTK